MSCKIFFAKIWIKYEPENPKNKYKNKKNKNTKTQIKKNPSFFMSRVDWEEVRIEERE